MNLFQLILIILIDLFSFTYCEENKCLNGADCQTDNEGIYCTTNASLTNSISTFISTEILSIHHIKSINSRLQLVCFPFYDEEQVTETCWSLANSGKQMDKDNQYKFLIKIVAEYLPANTDLEFFHDFLPLSTCYTFKPTTCRKTYIGSPTIKTSIEDQVTNLDFKSTFLMDNIYKIYLTEFGLTNNLIWCDFHEFTANSFSCIKDLQNNSSNFIETYDQKLIRDDRAFFKCVPGRPELQLTESLYLVYNIGYGISCFFLFLHIMAAMTIKALRQYPRNITLSISIALMFNQIMYLLVVQVKATLTGCFIMYGTYRFSQLLLYLWMNVLAFDAWKTFCNTTRNRSSNKGLHFYILYTLVCSICIVSCDIIVMIFTKKETLFHYKFYHNSCFIGKPIHDYVFYIPTMLIILFINCIFFFLISKKIMNISMSRVIHLSNNVTKYHIYWKLGLLVGIPWIIDVVPVILSDKYQNASDIIQYIALAFIIPQGPIMFYLFGLTPKFKEKLVHFVVKCCKKANTSANLQINSKGQLKSSTTTLNSFIAT